MRAIILALLIILSGNTAYAGPTEELLPVQDGKPVFEHEEITLEGINIHKYKIKEIKVETYSNPYKEETLPKIKKGRLSIGAGFSKKTQSDVKVGDKLLLEPSFSLTDEFSLLFINKVNPASLGSHQQEMGLKYSPKKLEGTSFSVLGGEKDGKQKVKFNTDFYIW